METPTGWKRFDWRTLPIHTVAVQLPAAVRAARKQAGEHDPGAFALTCLIDTGASHTCATRKLFDRLTARPTGDRIIAGGSAECSGTFDNFRLDLVVPYTTIEDGLRLPDFPISEIDLRWPPGHPPLYEMIIGQDVLRFVRLTIDGPAGLFRIEPAAAPQIRTRVYGKGHGEALLSDVTSGETILPIADTVMFNAAGGQAIAGTTADSAQSQILTYLGVQGGGGGSLIGPGAAPTVAPFGSVVSGGTELGVGSYQYGYTFVTASGESITSPLFTLAVGSLAAPQFSPSFVGAGGGTLAAGFYDYVQTFVTADGETTVSPRTTIHSAGTSGSVITIDTGPTGVIARRVYRTIACASAGVSSTTQLQLLLTINDNTTTSFTDTTPDASLGANAPTTNTTIARRVNLAIGLGPSGTTARKVYRTAVNASQLKLLTTLADNVTQNYSDLTPDGSLGANAPTGDTSGLAFASGQINAGATSLLTSNSAPFATRGGWISLSGQQTVRYTGISGNTLTGIPASGPGAIRTTVLYGSQVLPGPALYGINAWNGVSLAMAKGAPVNIWVQRDDVAAQTALGLLERDVNGNPTDGIREYMIVDERSSEARMAALCDADLGLFSRPIVTVEYYTRDPKTRAGRTVHIDIPELGPTGDYVIQNVTITFQGPALYPLYHVVATSVVFRLQDLLRTVVLQTAP